MNTSVIQECIKSRDPDNPRSDPKIKAPVSISLDLTMRSRLLGLHQSNMRHKCKVSSEKLKDVLYTSPEGLQEVN